MNRKLILLLLPSLKILLNMYKCLYLRLSVCIFLYLLNLLYMNIHQVYIQYTPPRITKNSSYFSSLFFYLILFVKNNHFGIWFTYIFKWKWNEEDFSFFLTYIFGYTHINTPIAWAHFKISKKENEKNKVMFKLIQNSRKNCFKNSKLIENLF